MHKNDQPQIDTLEELYEASYGSAVYLNVKPVDGALTARLAARSSGLTEAMTTEVYNVHKGEPANQAMPMQKKARRAA